MELKERSYEEIDRDGRWYRSFSLRIGEPWILIEHWASENGYRMVAMKGNSKRLYVKNQDSKWLRQYVEFRGTESRMEIKAWMLPGWMANLAGLYRLPIPLNLLEEGWIGKRVRRQFTLELNALLTRLRQSLMTGSLGFHWTDLRPETVAFGGGLVLLTLLFPTLFLAQMPLTKSWLGYTLTQTLHQFLWVAIPAVIGGAALALACRITDKRWIRATVAGVAFVLFAGIGGYRFHQDLGKHVTKVAFANCFEDVAERSCQALLQTMPADRRTEMVRQMDRLRELVQRK